MLAVNVYIHYTSSLPVVTWICLRFLLIFLWISCSPTSTFIYQVFRNPRSWKTFQDPGGIVWWKEGFEWISILSQNKNTISFTTYRDRRIPHVVQGRVVDEILLFGEAVIVDMVLRSVPLLLAGGTIIVPTIGRLLANWRIVLNILFDLFLLACWYLCSLKCETKVKATWWKWAMGKCRGKWELISQRTAGVRTDAYEKFNKSFLCFILYYRYTMIIRQAKMQIMFHYTSYTGIHQYIFQSKL